MLWDKDITKKTKRNIYNATYGCKVWQLKKNSILLKEMDSLCRSSRISRRERKIRNPVIRKKMEVKIQ